MCENGCVTFGMVEFELIKQLETRLRRIEDKLKNHEMILVEKVI